MKHNLRFLVIEDDDLNRDLLTTLLKSHGKVTEASTSKEAERLLDTMEFDVAFVDLDLHGKKAGYELAKISKENKIYTVILTGQKDRASISKAFEYSKCDNYLFKPASSKLVNDVLAHFDSASGSDPVAETIAKKFPTKSQKVAEALDLIKSLYQSTQPVYLFGPTGSGKQVMAELIHELKFNNLSQFYHLNCASISDTMIESELFGHLKGAFTGADSRKIGLFEKANGGTLFLDELATMSQAMQNKIITAIETKKFRPVGSEKEVQSTFRLIAATSGNISEEINQGKFRSDLFFRLNGTHITVPSLKERILDLPALIETIIPAHSSQKALYLSPDMFKILSKYDWPGNIRELKNLIFSWLDRSVTAPALKDVPEHIIHNENIFDKSKLKLASKKQLQQIKEMGLSDFLKAFESEVIEIVYKENRKKLRPTARTLQVHTDRIYSYLNKNAGKQYDLLQ